VENPLVEFGRPAAGVVGGWTEAEHDDAEIVEEMPPHEEKPKRNRHSNAMEKR
jgi:hypothetical protein